MNFTVKKLDDGKFGLYNKTKKEMSKKTFKTKEAAEKMGTHYQNFSQLRKTKKEKTDEVKEYESPPKKKIRVIKKKKVEEVKEE